MSSDVERDRFRGIKYAYAQWRDRCRKKVCVSCSEPSCAIVIQPRDKKSPTAQYSRFTQGARIWASRTPYCVILYDNMLHSITSRCITNQITSSYMALKYLHQITQQYIALHNITLYYITLDYITLRYIT